VKIIFFFTQFVITPTCFDLFDHALLTLSNSLRMIKTKTCQSYDKLCTKNIILTSVYLLVFTAWQASEITDGVNLRQRQEQNFWILVYYIYVYVIYYIIYMLYIILYICICNIIYYIIICICNIIYKIQWQCHFVKEKKFSWFYTKPDDDSVNRNMSL
jgi:hypothetical protein